MAGASRTDAGVHARGQVASFRTERAIPLHGIRRGLNSLLPPSDRDRRRERGRRGLPSAVLGDRQALPLPILDPRRPLAALARSRVAPPRAARSRRDARGRGGADRRARLRGVPRGRLHGEDAPCAGSIEIAIGDRPAASRRSSRSTSAATRSCATWCGSSSGPWSRSAQGRRPREPSGRDPCVEGPDPGRHRPPRRTASSWSRSATTGVRCRPRPLGVE